MQFQVLYNSSAPVILIVKFANSFEHLIKTMQRMHYGKVDINERCSSRDVLLLNFSLKR